MSWERNCFTHNRLQWPWEADYSTLFNLTPDKIALCLHNRKDMIQTLKAQEFKLNAAVSRKKQENKGLQLPFRFLVLERQCHIRLCVCPEFPFTATGVWNRSVSLVAVAIMLHRGTQYFTVTIRIELCILNGRIYHWVKGESPLAGNRLRFMTWTGAILVPSRRVKWHQYQTRVLQIPHTEWGNHTAPSAPFWKGLWIVHV